MASARFSCEPGNRTLAHAVAAREFDKRSTLRASAAGLVRCAPQFRLPAHMLPALLRPVVARGGGVRYSNKVQFNFKLRNLRRGQSIRVFPANWSKPNPKAANHPLGPTRPYVHSAEGQPFRPCRHDPCRTVRRSSDTSLHVSLLLSPSLSGTEPTIFGGCPAAGWGGTDTH